MSLNTVETNPTPLTAEVEPVATEKVSEDSSPAELIAWMLRRFAGQRVVMTTAFGMEGCALIDMIAERTNRFKVVYIDTDFFFSETLALRDRLAERYPHVDFVRHGTTLTPEAQAERFGAELWKHDPDLCCRIRKVDPMREVMQDVDVWVTGLRRSQSATRGSVRAVMWDWQYEVLKISPLASWDRATVWQYVQAHSVPYNPLHERGYPSVGCTHCTRAVKGATVDSYSREGRWNGRAKLECGLHGDGI